MENTNQRVVATPPGYKVTYTQVREICKKRGIDVDDRLSSVVTAPAGKHPLWTISWNTGKPGKGVHHSPVISGPTVIINVISIDGISGEIKEQPGWEHLDN